MPRRHLRPAPRCCARRRRPVLPWSMTPAATVPRTAGATAAGARRCRGRGERGRRPWSVHGIDHRGRCAGTAERVADVDYVRDAQRLRRRVRAAPRSRAAVRRAQRRSPPSENGIPLSTTVACAAAIATTLSTRARKSESAVSAALGASDCYALRRGSEAPSGCLRSSQCGCSLDALTMEFGFLAIGPRQRSVRSQRYIIRHQFIMSFRCN